MSSRRKARRNLHDGPPLKNRQIEHALNLNNNLKYFFSNFENLNLTHYCKTHSLLVEWLSWCE